MLPELSTSIDVYEAWVEKLKTLFGNQFYVSDGNAQQVNKDNYIEVMSAEWEDYAFNATGRRREETYYITNYLCVRQQGGSATTIQTKAMEAFKTIASDMKNDVTLGLPGVAQAEIELNNLQAGLYETGKYMAVVEFRLRIRSQRA